MSSQKQLHMKKKTDASYGIFEESAKKLETMKEMMARELSSNDDINH